MTQTIFAICDGERDYAEKFYEFAHKKEADGFKVVLFTEYEECKLFMEKNRIGILLISEDFVKNEKDAVNAENTIILVKEKLTIYNGDASIYKFQSADTILKKVLDYCAEKNAPVFRRNCEKPLSIIGIYSPVKRAFQTTFAITLGQILATKGKTLYLNFEGFSGFDSMMASKNKANLMDLMYYWLCPDVNFSLKLESTIEHIGGLDYVPPVHSFMNFEGISAKQWIDFINSFEEHSDYEYLILNLSENVTGLFDILSLCKMVYTVTDDRRISTAKISQYEALLYENCKDDVIDKTKKFKIPVFREIPEDFDRLPYSELARYIKKELEFEEKRDKEDWNVI